MSAAAHRSAFASSQYRRFFPAASFSTLGGWALRFLLGWSAWDLTGSATWVGAVAGLMLAPALLLAPFFGIVSDRINPRNGLLITTCIHALIAGLAASAEAAGRFDLSILLLLATALGVATSAQTPLRLSLLPLLVPRESLPSAIGYSATVFNVSRILGPALGAWLLQIGSPALAYLGAALLTLCAPVFLAFITGRARDAGATSAGGFRQELRAGLVYARSHAFIRLVFAFTLVNALLGRTVIELLPALSGKLLAGDSTTLATLTASAGIGAILGGLIVSRQGGSEHRLYQLLRWGLAIGAVLVALLGFSADLPSIAVIVGAISLITTMAGTTSQALAQLLVDDNYRGRVLSLWTVIAMGAPALGALAMGALADRFTFLPVLIAFGGAALAAIVALRSTRIQP
ncbi:MAG: MFS transporter [Pseudomonadota bacterium]